MPHRRYRSNSATTKWGKPLPSCSISARNVLRRPPELSRTGATSPARGGDSSKLQRRTAVALPALRSAADLRRRGPRRWRLFMKRANRSSLGGLTFRRRGSSDSRQPVEQNGQAESRSDPKNHATARLPRHLQLSTSSSSSAVTVAPSSLHLSPFFKCHYRLPHRSTHHAPLLMLMFFSTEQRFTFHQTPSLRQPTSRCHPLSLFTHHQNLNLTITLTPD